jgi:hypothetical protein
MKTIIVKVKMPKPRFGPLHVNKASTQDSHAVAKRKLRKREEQRGWDD